MKLLTSLIVLLSLNAYTQEAHITVDAAKVLNRIPSTLYGSCIEDVNHEVYGGLYDQRIFGESFEEPAPVYGFLGWKLLKGEWRIGGGGNPEGAGPGFKLVRQTSVIQDGTISADILFRTRARTAGLLFRVSGEGHGQDNLDGYAVNVARGQRRVVLGKYQHDWEILAQKDLSFDPKDSLHLSVRMDGPRIRVYVNGAADPVIDYTDAQPFLTGKIGIHSENDAARFERIAIGSSQIIFTPAPIPQVSACWDAIGNGVFSIDTTDTHTGRQSQTITAANGRTAGIANSGLNHWGIAVHQGQRLEGSIFLHGNGPTSVHSTGPASPHGSGSIRVALESADGRKTYATANLTGIGTSWAKFPFSLTPNTTDAHARFVIYTQGGKLWVDQATLMSTGDRQFKGLPLRADIAAMMRKEGLTFLRYGGTMVNAAAYRWKNMTGPREHRPPYKGHWYPYGTNGFGIEEFVQFCEAAGFEPAFAINVEEKPEDIAAMVEYLTGDAATAGGRQRAAAGHPAPYPVHYIEIGNEEVIWGEKQEDYQHYAERFTILHKAIHDVNPNINLVCAAWWRPNNLSNMELVFRAIDGKAARWDLHTDADEPAAGTTVDKNLTLMQERFLQWDPQTTLKIAVFEENGGLHNMSRALGHATTLNAVRRHGDFVLTSCPANALQPYRNNDNDWDQGQIFFTADQVWGMPPFYAQQMASANHQPLRVEDVTRGDLDVTATRSEGDSILVIHVVNTNDHPISTGLTINNFPNRRSAASVSTLQGDLRDRNTPAAPEKVRAVTSTAQLPGDEPNYTFPAHSYTILKFNR